MSPACRACFAGSGGEDVKLHVIEHQLFEIYEKLTSTKLVTGHRLNTLCYLCYAQLRKCSRFSEMARRSEECLRDVFRNNTKVNSKMNSGWIPSLSVMSLKPLTLDGLSKSRTTKSKKEQLVMKHELITKQVIQDDEEELLTKKAKMNKEKIDSTQDLIAKLESEEIANEELYNIKLGLLSKEFDYDENISDFQEYVDIDQKDLFYECDKCKNLYPIRGELATHQCEKHDIQENYCRTCYKVFPGPRSRLFNHMRIHEERLFICDYCGQTSRTKHHLQEHIRVHTGEKVYCKFCNKSFSQLSSLGKHVLNHRVPKPYSCHICGKTFKQNGHMRSHVRFVHQGIRLHCCEVCGKIFQGKSHWQRHMETHSGTKAYSCNYCGTKFTTYSNKIRHIKDHCKKKPTELVQ